MTDTPHNLHSTFMEVLAKDRAPVTVFLNNGLKLQGVVEKFDAGAILLRREEHLQLIYITSVETILPVNAVDIKRLK